MKVTLTTSEIEHAISCYLRANAAVVVGDMVFTLKRTGIQVEVETTVKAMDMPEQLELDLPILDTPEETVFDEVTIGTDFTANPEELVDEVPEEETDILEEETILPEEEITEVEMDVLNNLDEAIAQVEAAAVEVDLPDTIVFDSPTEDVVTDMPVPTALSIAELLSSTS